LAKKASGKETEAKAEVPPDQTPLERMTELTRRIVAVPKTDALAPKKRPKGKPR
jgi:hypothetical protein